MTSERCSQCGHWSSPDPTSETGAGFMAIARGELGYLARFLLIVATGVLVLLIATGAVQALARLGS